MTWQRWDDALAAYYEEHAEVLLDAEAHGPSYLALGPERLGEPVRATGVHARIRPVRQILRDPDDNRDWVVDAIVDCDATDEVGELVLAVTAAYRLDG